jgi:hypothetical protein
VKDPRIWMATVGLLVAAGLVVPRLLPRRPPTTPEVAPLVAHVCRESGEVFDLPLVGPVAAHPATGRPTLVPAVYDERRRQWRPGPPLDEMRRRGLLRSVNGPADGR